jgi:hypothetical protein
MANAPMKPAVLFAEAVAIGPAAFGSWSKSRQRWQSLW